MYNKSVKLSLLLVAVASVSSFAAPAPLRLSGGAKAENKLRLFLEQDARLKARLEEASRRGSAFLSDSRETDLHDAVSDMSGDNLRLGLSQSQGERRKALLSALPGMKASSEPDCRTIVDCPSPDLALDAPDIQRLPDTLRRMVRPWMVLQQARGSKLEVSPTEGPGDAALTMRLADLDAKPLVLNVAPQPLGGFKVWFDSPFVLAALYGRERAAVLHPVR